MLVVNGRFLTQEITGVQRYAGELLAELSEIRSDMVILTPKTPQGVDALGGCEILQVGRNQGHRWEQTDLPRALRRMGAPILLSPSNTGPIRYPRHIATHHDLSYRRYPKSYSRSFRLAYRTIARPMLSKATRILTSSEFSKSELVSLLNLDPSKIHVVGGAPGSQFRPADVDRDPKSVLCVGSPSVHKGLRELLQAWEQVHRATGSSLHIVGRPLDVGKHLELPERDGITYLGRIDDAQLIAEYRQAAVFVFPSLYEGFGLPVLEAQACGTPVIASNRASIPEVLQKSGLLVDPESSNELANAIIRILRDPLLRADLGKRGIENAKRYSWKHSARLVDEVIDQVENS